MIQCENYEYNVIKSLKHKILWLFFLLNENLFSVGLWFYEAYRDDKQFYKR